MDEIELKRVNQLGITYHEGEIYESHYEIILRHILGLPENHILGIDDRGDRRFLFEVHSSELYESLCERFTGRDIPIDQGCVIQVDDISSTGTRIELSKVPFQVTNEMVSDMLKQYGEVYKVQNYYKKYGKYRHFSKTGNRIAWVKLDSSIPQTLLLKQTQTTIKVQCETQPMSCNKCGHTGHNYWCCSTQKNNHIHVVDLNQCIENILDSMI